MKISEPKDLEPREVREVPDPPRTVREVPPQTVKVIRVPTKVNSPGKEERLDRARTAADQLQKSTELLNVAIRAAEKEIAKLSLGVSASVELPTDGSYIHFVAFGKLSNEWKLIYQRESGPDYDEQPLLNANRELRVLAVGHIPELLEKLVLTAEMQAAELTSRAQKLDAFVKDLAKRTVR